MTTTTIANGQTSTNADVTNGNTLDIQSGGSAVAATIESGGTEIVESGGFDVGSTINAGGTETVSGSTNSAMVSGTQTIASGGQGNSETILSGGTQTIALGGQDNAATVAAGGTQTVNGSTSNAMVSGTQTVNAGGTDGTLTVNNGGVVTILKGGVANNSTVNAGGTLAINGNGQANGVTLQGGTLDLQTPKADAGATGILNFASGYSSTLSIDVPQPTITTFPESISNFAAGDVIDEKGLTFAGATLQTSTGGSITSVTVTGGNNTSSQTFNFFNAASTPFALASDGNGGTDIVACYASGTSILIARHGVELDVAVEHLAIGDSAVTVSGEHRPIRWIGSRLTHCRRHPAPHDVMPVRIRAGAFGPSRPARDLVVSPGHALCIDACGEVLAPAAALINGTTVVQEEVQTITYWHVELDSHDILIAENMPAESYLEMGNRGFFSASGVVDLAANPDGYLALRTHADFCRPFHADGPVIEDARRQMLARAEALGWQLVDGSLDEVHLLVDGLRVAPLIRDAALRFTLPAGADEVWLVSPAARPCDLRAVPDARRLGLAVSGLRVEDGFVPPRDVASCNPLLRDGFHADEGTHRWTTGRARLPAALWAERADGCYLRVDLAMPPLPQWRAPERAGEGAVNGAATAPARPPAESVVLRRA